MKPRTGRFLIALLIFPFFLYLVWAYWKIILNAILYLATEVESIKTSVGWMAALLNLGLYVKLRFIDTRTFHAIEKAYGKQRFIQALQVVIETLERITPEEMVTRILKMDDIDLLMRDDLAQLAASFKGIPPKRTPKLKLSRAVKKRLRREIKTLLNLVDKRLDLHYLEKEVHEGHVFASFVKHAVKKQAKLKRADAVIAERGKDKLT